MQHATIICNSCQQRKIFENSMQQNVSSHIATEIAILSQSDFNSRNKKFNGCNIQKNEDTIIFLTNQRAAFCSRAPHCLLSTSPTYNAQSCTKSRHLFASSQKPNHKSTTIAALSQTC
jgi:hypothetical protein